MAGLDAVHRSGSGSHQSDVELIETLLKGGNRYADLHRSAAVWNVVAATEFSLELKTWCFPVTGCVGYRGYYDEAKARAEAQSLAQQGYFDDTVFQTVITRTVRFPETTVAGQPITTWAPTSSGASAYRDLAKEVLAL